MFTDCLFVHRVGTFPLMHCTNPMPLCIAVDRYYSMNPRQDRHHCTGFTPLVKADINVHAGPGPATLSMHPLLPYHCTGFNTPRQDRHHCTGFTPLVKEGIDVQDQGQIPSSCTPFPDIIVHGLTPQDRTNITVQPPLKCIMGNPGQVLTSPGGVTGLKNVAWVMLATEQAIRLHLGSRRKVLLFNEFVSKWRSFLTVSEVFLQYQSRV